MAAIGGIKTAVRWQLQGSYAAKDGRRSAATRWSLTSTLEQVQFVNTFMLTQGNLTLLAQTRKNIDQGHQGKNTNMVASMHSIDQMRLGYIRLKRIFRGLSGMFSLNENNSLR